MKYSEDESRPPLIDHCAMAPLSNGRCQIAGSYEGDVSDDAIGATKAQGRFMGRQSRLALAAALVSPKFLFRIELDADPHDPQKIRGLDDYELATRLSYFLWSTMPDDELFALAAKRTLSQPAVLHAQVERIEVDLGQARVEQIDLFEQRGARAEGHVAARAEIEVLALPVPDVPIHGA